MRVQGRPMRPVWREEDGAVGIIDQTRLPHALVTLRLETVEQAAHAIRSMQVRGAPLIGATAAWGVYLALRQAATEAALERACAMLGATRPTAVNLRWALERVRAHLGPVAPAERVEQAREVAESICEEDVALNRALGEHGLRLLREAWERKGRQGRLNVLTHCNAGWLATVDWGTALAPVYLAHDEGLPVHVWVDETRPRNQGASLTAWELGQHGVPHTVVADNVGGHLMQHGLVDVCIVGTDRTTARGDVANKIGTYLKALAARDNGVPFYVALPSPSIDWELEDGVRDIPIEQREGTELSHVSGRLPSGEVATVQVLPEGSPVGNWGFDVTPARLVTALITERGVCPASAEGLLWLFPERRRG